MQRDTLHVLVVDDEEDMQWLFRQHFRKEIKANTLSFHFALSGEDALTYMRSLKRADIVLVLSDINMPGMTGLELLKWLKQEYAGVPVHIITAYGDEQNYRSAMQYGADGYLTKPIDFAELKQTIVRMTA
ncbi:MAG: response regulator [Rhodothermales bacterium]|nr:response regulator [Rhodothermales bacterium]